MVDVIALVFDEMVPYGLRYNSYIASYKLPQVDMGNTQLEHFWSFLCWSSSTETNTNRILRLVYISLELIL